MVIDSIPKAAGMAYAIIATVLIIVMLRRGVFSKRKGYVFLVISTLFGFLVFAPMLPFQFQTVILGNAKQLGAPLPLAIIVIVAFIVLAFMFGRAFCGYVCPIGAVQELLYKLPVKKFRMKIKAFPVVFRYLFFIAFIAVVVVSSEGLLRYLGVRDFFHLDAASASFYIFLAILLTSTFFYRPFCRFLCPYGVLLSLAAIKSRFGLQRTDDCIDCGKCERACPTGEAARPDLKQECYMCMRCKNACPNDAIVYTWRLREPQGEKVGEAVQPAGTGE